VRLTYDSGITGKEQNDEYILYFNSEIPLVYQYYFSLPAFSEMKPILLMTLNYEKVDGLQIATVRKSFPPNASGEFGINGIYTSKKHFFQNSFTVSNY